jgi:SAM-dependent methyltransferase
MTVVGRHHQSPVDPETMHGGSTLNVDARWEAYGELCVPPLRIRETLLVGMGGVNDTDRVLDVGCAGGKHLARLRREHPNAKLVGIDIDDLFMVTQAELEAEGLPPIDFRVGRLERLPFVDNSFDKAFVEYVLYYLEDPRVGLRELQRVVRPGGLVGFATIAPDNKPVHRKLEWEIARLIGATDPKVPAATFDSSIAKGMIEDYFQVVAEDPAYSAMVVVTPEEVDIYVRSLWTMRTAREEHYPEAERWEWAVQQARALVEDVIAQQGELRDIIRHHWYVARNTKPA